MPYTPAFVPAFQAENLLKASQDTTKNLRPLEHIAGIMIHRVDPAGVKTIAEVAHVFHRVLAEMPYTCVVWPTAQRIDQALALADVGPHHRTYKVPAIGIGIIGDFRPGYDSPRHDQWIAARDLCAWLLVWLGRDGEALFEHHQECPGDAWPIESFRADVERERLRVLAAMSDKLDRDASSLEIVAMAEHALLAAGLAF